MLLFAFLFLFAFADVPDAVSQTATFALLKPLHEKNIPRVYVPSSLPPLNEFTLCHWYRPLAGVISNSSMLDYASTECHDEIHSGMTFQSDTVYISVKNFWRSFRLQEGFFRYDINVTQWMHMCFTFSSYTNSVNFYIDGKLHNKVTDLNYNRSIVGGGHLYFLANEIDIISTSLFHTYNSGEISELHLWDTVLCPSQIKNVSLCSSDLVGNVLNWKKLKMQLFDGVEVRLIDNEDICAEQKKCAA